MKNQLKTIHGYLLAAAMIITGATSCKKEVSVGAEEGIQLATTATSTTIAVSAGGSGSDSVYVINPCEKGTRRDSVAATSLPASLQTYLGANYTGYAFGKAYTVKDTTGAVKGYVVIINFNGKPVALEFKADGAFVKVLEQKEKGDFNGRGWHPGGRFEKRNGEKKDTVALASLAATIKGYFTANYAGDTLVKAFQLIGGHYLVISKNNGLFATVFTNGGAFFGRLSLTTLNALVGVADAALPSTALNYLSATYPNYVLDKSFSVRISGTLQGYIALIDANNTRYCVAFDASGKFVAAKAIW